MSNMLPSPPVLALAAAVLLIVLCGMAMSTNVPISHDTMDSIRNCLSPEGADTGQLLEERAGANTRLVKAFNLTNTFVSHDHSIHSTFVTHARMLIKHANKQGWTLLRDLSTQAVQFELGQIEQSGHELPFDTFIQCLCLRIVLVGLLGVDASVESFAQEDVCTVTHHINVLWALSKKAETIPPHLLPQLKDALRRLIPDADKYPNPVDFVIPAWETLWRVVAIAVAYSHQDEDMVDAFQRLYLQPNLKNFDGRGVSLSAKNIVDETMRLHPPSKHIGRMKLRKPATYIPSPIIRITEKIIPGVLRTKESADVFAIQRSQDIWGPDADKFNPSRFLRYSETPKNQEAALAYVFGGGPFRCIGASWAPMAVAIISSAVIAVVSDREDLKITSGAEIGGRDGWNKWSVTHT